jgi:hypothetical protein
MSMRKTSIILALTLSGAAMAEEKMVTTTIRNGNSFATVTQSGDPATTVKKIEKRPGYTRIEQQNANSRTVILQSDNPADMPQGDQRLRPEARDRIPPDVRARLSPEVRRRLFGE